MLNQIVLVGRLTKDVEIKTTDQGKKYAFISLAVPRTFKNIDGTYDTDFINCTLWEATAKNTAEYCKKGDIIGIKGRLQSDTYEKDKEKIYKIEAIAEKVTFLSNKPKAEES